MKFHEISISMKFHHPTDYRTIRIPNLAIVTSHASEARGKRVTAEAHARIAAAALGQQVGLAQHGPGAGGGAGQGRRRCRRPWRAGQGGRRRAGRARQPARQEARRRRQAWPQAILHVSHLLVSAVQSAEQDRNRL